MKRFLKTLLALVLFLNYGICNKQLHLINNGEKHWVDIGDLDIQGDQVTVEALIFKQNTLSGNIVSKHMGFENVNYLFRLRTFEITTYKNGNSGETEFYNLSVPFNYNLNQWYHVAATYDGAMMKYYVNGCKVAEMEARGNLVQNNFATSIGNRSNETNEQYYGWLDEVRIWNVARTEEEIQANMMEVDLENGLLGYYKFDSSLDNEIGNRFHNGTRGRPGEPLAIDSNPVEIFEEVDFEIIEPICHGGNDGGILITSNADYNYSITGEDFSEDKEILNLKAGNYLLHVEGRNVCFILKDSLEITEPDLIETTFTEEICIGDSIEFMGNIFNRPGNYIDTSTAQNGCDSLVIFKLQYLKQDFLGNDTTLCSALPFTIKSTHPNTQWLGYPPSQNLTISQSGLYIATYEDDKGCTIRDSVSVEYLDSIQAFIPSAFSPNDDGINDIFEPFFNNPTEYELQVFDRWGNQLFNKNEGWDGRFDGKKMNTGVYLWVLEITRDACGTIEKVIKAGEINLFGRRN